MKLYTKSLAEEIVGVLAKAEVATSEQNGTFRVIASTDDLDRHGEVILQDGWKLDNYRKNPVVIVDHRYSVEKIVGKATDISIEGGKMLITGVFADTPLAQDVRKLYESGFLKTVSVGLIPLARDEYNRDIITSAELIELSFVPVPANPEALDALKKLGMDAEAWTVRKESETDVRSVLEKHTGMLEALHASVERISKQLADGKAYSDAEKEAKEALQEVNRTVSEALRNFKVKKR